MIEIREAASCDAEVLTEVIKSAEDSGYMLFDPGEREISPAPFAEFIETLKSSEKSGFFVAVEEDRIIGYLIAQSEKPKRISHRTYLVIGVHKGSRGKGVGKKLLQHTINWAKKVQLHRLELTVITKNDAAIALYKNIGFKIEGVKEDSLMINGTYTDEYYMAKLI